jgi:hypothetical protein
MIAKTLQIASGSLKFWDSLAEYQWTKVQAMNIHDVPGFAFTSFAI